MTNHTVTPWIAQGIYVCRDDMAIIANCDQSRFERDIDIENAKHIVRCVNVHQGLVDALKACYQEMEQIKGEIHQLYLHIEEPEVVLNIAEYIRTIPASGHNFDDALTRAKQALLAVDEKQGGIRL